jgi:ribosome-associated protein
VTEHERPSKSARKREAQAIRELADQLVAMPAAALAGVCDDTDILEAVEQARHMTSFGASRRQRQYIARLLRDRDVEPLRAAVEATACQDESARQRFRRAEKLRTELLSGDTARREAALARLGEPARNTLAPLLQRHASAPTPASAKPLAKQIFRICHDALGDDTAADRRG